MTFFFIRNSSITYKNYTDTVLIRISYHFIVSFQNDKILNMKYQHIVKYLYSIYVIFHVKLVLIP
jgi:hypothetical protein